MMSFYRFLYLLSTPALLMSDYSMAKVFEEGAVHGQLKLFSYNIEKTSDEDAYANAVGGYLKYSTDIRQPFYALVRFHTSLPMGYGENREDTALFNDNGNALTVNSEAYIGWRTPTRVFKVGNLMLNTPMMNDDTTRIVPWSYQGVAITGETIENTKVQINYIRKIRSYTSDKYTKESASGEIGSGITMLGVVYDGFEHFDLQSYYYYAPDLYSTFIAQVDYKRIFDKDNMFCASIQYFKSGNGGKFAETENKSGGDDIDLLAMKIGFDAEDWEVSLNYSQNFGISGINKGYGGLSKVFTSSMIANGRGNYSPQTWMIKTAYEFPVGALGQSDVAVTYTKTRVKDSRGDNFDAYYMHWKHRFNVDTSLFVRFENMDYKGDKSNANYLRIIAAYDF